jgi:endonuclease/exonuclease/phosphatase family metal-dependent hydrolase
VAESLRVASWNIQAIRGTRPARLHSIVTAVANHRPDVVTLQEVSARPDVPDQLCREFAEIGLAYFVFSGRDHAPTEEPREKRYGNVIASRWPITNVDWPERMRWPQLIAAADVRALSGLVRLVTAHIPNGQANGWDKVFAFEALLVGLQGSRGPTILTGDFNEPRQFTPFTSFGARRSGTLTGTFTDLFDITDERIRWQRAVEGVLSPNTAATAWGGTHVVTQLGADFEPTHLARGHPKMFDHILTSPQLRATVVTFDHTVRESKPRLSDHSMVIATIETGPSAPVSPPPPSSPTDA